LLQGFRLLGIDAAMGRGVIKPPQHEICFLRGTLGSIMHRDRKFVGSAQTWHASSMLQHWSIILVPQIEACGLWSGAPIPGGVALLEGGSPRPGDPGQRPRWQN
jgi:hypothetical protein